MNYPNLTQPRPSVPLVELLGSVIDEKKEWVTRTAQIESFMQRASGFEEMMRTVSQASSGLNQKCQFLAHNVREIRTLGSGLFWSTPQETKKEYCFLLASPFPRRLARNKPFSLTFRVIDREGKSVKLGTNEACKLNVLEDIGTVINRPGKHERSTPLILLQGQTVSWPQNSGEIQFSNLSFAYTSNNSPTGKFTLEISCPGNQCVKTLALDPITVKYVLKGAKKEARTEGLNSLMD